MEEIKKAEILFKAISIVALAIVFFSFFTSVSSVNISSCTNLNTSNTLYTLTANIDTVNNCFNITGENITFDGQGFYLRGNSAVSTPGINVSNSKNITIINLGSRLAKGSGFSPYIKFENTNNSRLYNISINGLSDLQNSHNNFIENSTLTNNDDGIIILKKGSTNNSILYILNDLVLEGILLTDQSNNNTIEYYNHSGSGISPSFGIRIVNSSYNILRNNFIDKAFPHGIELISNSSFNTIINTNFSRHFSSNRDFFLTSSSNNLIINATSDSGNQVIYLNESNYNNQFINIIGANTIDNENFEIVHWSGVGFTDCRDDFIGRNFHYSKDDISGEEYYCELIAVSLFKDGVRGSCNCYYK